ncbi:Nn.00g061940.m01.CDS01 [Neocucurbitaria sp. VM-36]
MRIPAAWRALWYLVFLTVLVLGSVIYTLDFLGLRGGDALGGFKFGSSTGMRVWDWGGGGHSGDGGDGSGKEEKKVEELDELPDGVHPIEYLMSRAEARFIQMMLVGQTTNLHDAAAAYRTKRGRHPPPGFDAWYEYAMSQKAVIVEDFWDQIYQDLAPFWSIEPVLLRKQGHVFTPKISIREGKIEAHTHNVYAKLDVWADMLRALVGNENATLPDMDIPFNVNKEPALLVPWETVDTAVSLARPRLLDPVDVSTEYSGLEDIDKLTSNFTFDPEWRGPRLTHPDSHLGPRPLWSLVRPACRPGSSTRTGHVFNDIWDPEGGTSEEHLAAALLPLDLPEISFNGYAKDWTMAIDACKQQNLQALHSAFVAPSSMQIATKLFPLFGDTKLSMSSEILIPGATEWNSSASTSSNVSILWEDRASKLYWRGPVTQGHDPARYWQRFHRHRLVSMLNATHVEIAEASIHSGNESTVGVGYAKNFRLLPANEYHLRSQTWGQLAEWVNEKTNVAFMDLKCDMDVEGDGCPYIDEYFSVVKPSTEEDNLYKYGIVVDGDSGDDGSDFIRNLNNAKLTIRGSIYRKWYDSRLIPWLHFVPMSTTFVDLYGILEYFVGTHVSEEARHYSHAVGEVQYHEHHFNTPTSEAEKELEHVEHTQNMDADHHGHTSSATSSPIAADGDTQIGNEPYDFDHSHASSRKRDQDGHDAAAKKIADEGHAWAAKVARKEDILIYVYRLLLEYARIVDDRRERLGWIHDLLED